MKKNVLKVMVIAIVMLMLISATSISYAYWDSLSSTADVDINIGENTILTVVVDGNTADGKTLVPAGVMMGANDVDSVTFTYTAALSKTPVNAAAFTVAVVSDSVKIGGDSTYASLVNISINSPAEISDTATIIVTVTLTEPNDQIEYTAVAGKQITFDLSLSAE